MASLSSELRRKLEKAVVEARKVAEQGARQALESLTVHEAKRGGHIKTDEQIQLRNRLRAHGRFLGDRRDATGAQSIDRLVEECAYQHWHRILFARFLAENDCLWHPDLKALVSLEEVEELAHEEGTHQWELAGRFAQAALPAVFPADNPVLEVKLPPEVLSTLIELVEEPASQKRKTGLAREVFRADDSLGWVYQFWQNDANKRANASEEKINAATLPAVTQFFTEDYMVMFLLHNTLGAWHASKVLAKNPELAKTAKDEDELRRAVSLTEAGGYEFEYLRFVRESQRASGGPEPTALAAGLPTETPNAEGPEASAYGSDGDGPWRPMGGVFEGWPRTAAELKVLDPCCGSGHFLVAAFELLVRLRMHEESISLSTAIDSVLEDNLFGLELDKRCVQIAVFNVAMSAWKMDRYRELPSMTIAHVGQSIGATREQWMKLLQPTALAAGLEHGAKRGRPAASAVGSVDVEGLGFFWGQLYDMFSQASTLGSLINPRRSLDSFLLSDEQTEYLYNLLENAVATDPNTEPESHELGLAAKGLATATRLLSRKYHLVLTNVPYLGAGRQSDSLRSHIEDHYEVAKPDLATACISRVLEFCDTHGDASMVVPQNWLFLSLYHDFRVAALRKHSWNFVSRLGPGAFATISGHVVNVALLNLSARSPTEDQSLCVGDVTDFSGAEKKAVAVLGEPLSVTRQQHQLLSPDSRITRVPTKVESVLFSRHATPFLGLGTGDYLHYGRKFWEFAALEMGWAKQQGSFKQTKDYNGREHVVAWDDRIDRVRGMSQDEREQIHNQDQSGQQAWSKIGVCVSLARTLNVSLYTGEKFEKATAVLVPKSDDELPALWEFSKSSQFGDAVREIDRKVIVANGALVKIPYDSEFWSNEAKRKYPDGLPEPESDDLTQWLFHGWPSESTSPMQVAVARLLGYRWPAELDAEMRLSERARALIARCSELDSFIDDDGIVCIPSVRGEDAAVDRLARLIQAVKGSDRAAEPTALAAGLPTIDQDSRPAASAVGSGLDVTDLDDWLRNKFFKEHCDTFDQRPFVWHIYDGRKQDGFHALVNYHKLAGPGGRKVLESLTYSYLGDWIKLQKDEVKRELPAAEARLLAAEELFKRLEAILAGEPPYDLFVRWKPIHEQPIGFDPDINDGVRINIRPFMAVDLQGVPKDAGVFRIKPKIKWTKDRGKEPQRPMEEYPWFWSWDEQTANFTGGDKFDGVRWNDCHYTKAFKQAARNRTEPTALAAGPGDDDGDRGPRLAPSAQGGEQ